jgi:hypothetical protein
MEEMNGMEITVSYGSYNQRRYGKPWIGKIIDWPAGGYAKLNFGTYYGTDAGGEVAITAQPGDIIRHGQKDYRGNNTSKDYYIVNQDGSLSLMDAATARKQWLKKEVKV